MQWKGFRCSIFKRCFLHAHYNFGLKGVHNSGSITPYYGGLEQQSSENQQFVLHKYSDSSLLIRLPYMIRLDILSLGKFLNLFLHLSYLEDPTGKFLVSQFDLRIVIRVCLCSLFWDLYSIFHVVTCDKYCENPCGTVSNATAKNWSIWDSQTRCTLFTYNCDEIMIKELRNAEVAGRNKDTCRNYCVINNH